MVFGSKAGQHLVGKGLGLQPKLSQGCCRQGAQGARMDGLQVSKGLFNGAVDDTAEGVA